MVVASTFGRDVSIGDYTIDLTTGSALERVNAAAMPLLNQSITTLGTLHSTDSLWTRRDEECRRADNPERPFDLHFFRNTSPSELVVFEARAEFLDDGFLHVYDADRDFNFDDLDEGLPAMSNGWPCMAGNDDSGGLNRSEVSSVVFPGGTVAIVVSARATTPLGPYSLEFEVVPNP